MVNLKKYQKKKIAIYGLGKTGQSAAKIFKGFNSEILCWDDSAKVRKKLKKLNFNIKKFWLNKYNIKNIVISPGIDIYKCKIKKYLKKNFEKIITDLDLFFELNKKATLISITGTNGKSTTCKIIEKILSTAKYNVKTVGNIGNPILYSHNKRKKFILILEVSSYQLQYSKLFRSKHAAILNISPDHLERHKNMKNYTEVKSKIFYAQKKTDYSYINFNDKYINSVKKIFTRKKIKSKLVVVNNSNGVFLLKKIKNKYFESKGNKENFGFAYMIAKNFNISDKIIVKALDNFKGLPHRQEVIFSNKKILCVNDSKATSFDASYQSLSNYKNIYWIVGGLPKQKDKFYLNKVRKKIIKAYIIGKNPEFFKNEIKGHIPYIISRNIKNALKSIHSDLRTKNNYQKTILLSPAAASFDQFYNFEIRGEYFKDLVIKKFNKKNA